MTLNINKIMLSSLGGQIKIRNIKIADTFTGFRCDHPQPAPSGSYLSLGILKKVYPSIQNIPGSLVVKWAYIADLWIENKYKNASPD